MSFLIKHEYEDLNERPPLPVEPGDFKNICDFCFLCSRCVFREQSLFTPGGVVQIGGGKNLSARKWRVHLSACDFQICIAPPPAVNNERSLRPSKKNIPASGNRTMTTKNKSINLRICSLWVYALLNTEVQQLQRRKLPAFKLVISFVTQK